MPSGSASSIEERRPGRRNLPHIMRMMGWVHDGARHAKLCSFKGIRRREFACLYSASSHAERQSEALRRGAISPSYAEGEGFPSFLGWRSEATNRAVSLGEARGLCPPALAPGARGPRFRPPTQGARKHAAMHRTSRTPCSPWTPCDHLEGGALFSAVLRPTWQWKGDYTAPKLRAS